MPELNGHGRWRARRLRCCQIAIFVGTLAFTPVAEGGTSYQGFSMNGSLFQGSALQGQFLNGSYMNGTTFQGSVLEGVAVRGTLLVGGLAGRVVSLPAGTLLRGQLAGGGSVALRIDGVEQDPTPTLFEDPAQRSNRDVYLYAVSFQDPQGGRWVPLCPGNE